MLDVEFTPGNRELVTIPLSQLNYSRPHPVVGLLDVLYPNPALLLGVLPVVGEAAALVGQALPHDEGLPGGVLELTELEVRLCGAAQSGLLPRPHLHTLQSSY